MLAVRWYLRYGLAYRDLEELLAERRIDVDHVTLFRWVQRFTPQMIDSAHPCRRAVGDRWFVDETYVKIAGVWRYVYRAVDQNGQILDVFVSRRRDAAAATWFFAKARRDHDEPLEIVTDKSPTLASVIADLAPDAEHCTQQFANNGVECDHGRLKARLRPMRGLKTDRTASTVIRGHAFVAEHPPRPLPVQPRARPGRAAQGGIRRAPLDTHSLRVIWAAARRVSILANATEPVQFIACDGDWLRGESVDNRYLDEAHLLSTTEQRELELLGWNPPETDTGDSGNYWRMWEPPDVFDAAQLAALTLERVHHLTAPNQAC